MPFSYPRTIHFHETDAAGVVFFANGLTLCHEAYEASLAAAGIALGEFFTTPTLAYPIVHASLDFRHPLRCGDAVVIQVQPQATTATDYQVNYQIQPAAAPTRTLVRALTRHVCIDPSTRRRVPLPPAMQHWLQHWGPPSTNAAPGAPQPATEPLRDVE